MKRGEIKKISLIILIVLLFLPAGLSAYEHGGDQEQISFIHEEGMLWDVSSFVRDLAVVYSQELQRGTNSADLKFQPGLGDNLYLMDQWQSQARTMAQTAFRSVIRQTVEQVDLLHTLKTYSERLTSTQFRVTADDIQVSGPSLRHPLYDDRIGRPARSPILFVKSGMSLTDSIRIAPMIQAHLGDLNSKVIYDPIAGGDWRFSLDRSITSHSAVEMVYLLKSTDHQNLLATLRFGF